MPDQNQVGFGLHLTLDGYGGPKNTLADKNLVTKALHQLPDLLNMQRITKPQVIWYSGMIPEDCGVSGIVMIAESHISIHTFSEKNFLTADVYSCKIFDTEKTINYFKKHFSLKELEINIIRRGLKFPKTVVHKSNDEKLQVLLPPVFRNQNHYFQVIRA
ncbi:adenosylmethionine decarboxylase [Candidatus Curtissbacteria bacterium]|nr:adenosylmethionine decarboxylase [Candidatus Curtissbacteria bacterium]